MNSKQKIIDMLMQEVERRYGIAPGNQVERKLVRIFEVMGTTDTVFWGREMLSPDAPESEWLSLVECLTVHETYFNRDKELIAVLAAELLPQMIAQKQQSGDLRLRVWSAGCSSGEETYNLAMLVLMAMETAGSARECADGSIVPLPGWNISVLGSDISVPMIRMAENATYSTVEMGSFRTMDPQLWRFFDQIEEQERNRSDGRSMRVKRCVSEITGFRHHNLLEPLLEEEPFDLVICRNVLIYFNKYKKNVQVHLSASLAPGGTLMLGATDTLLCRDGLEPHHRDGVFWYVKTATGG